MTKKVKITVALKYLSNFWRTLKISWINCEINLDLNWSKNCTEFAKQLLMQQIKF